MSTPQPDKRPRIAVAAPHAAALDSARLAIEAGGNALDAALAAATALAVVYPHQCSVGGDLVALVRHSDGRVSTVLSIGAAPAGVDVETLATAGLMPAQGANTVTVPGAVAGWSALANLGATIPLADSLRRAAELARTGTPVSAGLARALAGRRDLLLTDEGMAGVFGTGDGGVLAEGDLLLQPALASTLDTLAENPNAFYTGDIAASIAHRLTELGGSMTPADFAAHRVETPAPLSVEANGARWWVAPPPSQGAVLLGILAEAITAAETVTPETALEFVIAAREGALTRASSLGDPRGGDIDLASLLNPRQRVVEAELPTAGRALGDTVAVVAADGDGTVVTLIQSVYQWFGSGVLDAGTGVVLHNRGSAFSVDPRHPGHIGPGLRPPHTLLPVIIETDDMVVGLGCQGGSAQPWILAQVAPALTDPAADPRSILDRGRWVIGAKDLGQPVLTLVAEPGTELAVDAARSVGLPTVLEDHQ
ncbi:MAG: tyramine oxidase, partial [Glaciihabitans sp.]|nr:tyramine oxidase [Glaciihabitans sp.]